MTNFAAKATMFFVAVMFVLAGLGILAPAVVGFTTYGFNKEGARFASLLGMQLAFLSFALGTLFYAVRRMAGRRRENIYILLRHGVVATFFINTVNLAYVFLSQSMLVIGVSAVQMAMIAIHLYYMYRIDPTTPE